MNSNNYCVIMAGGLGSRFWPLSKMEKPKQFLDILGIGRSLIQQTYDRFKPLIPEENFIVVTSDIYVDLVKEHLPQIPVDNILAEPARRNTAPCIAYASYKIYQKNKAANIIVTPADHLVINVTDFRNVIDNAVNFAKDRVNLVTIGIKPTRPETGYGYIQTCDEEDDDNYKVDYEGAEKVKTFTEKPDLKMAEIFFKSGKFLWNSGIFIWSVKSILDALLKHLPDMNFLFDNKPVYNTSEEKNFIKDVYSKVSNISIDKGVMEKADNVFVFPAEFGWSDLGTWGSLYDYSEKDKNQNVVLSDNVLLYDTKKSIVSTKNTKLVVLHGLKNAIVAESESLLLISTLKDEQKIKEIVNDIKLEKGDKFV